MQNLHPKASSPRLKEDDKRLNAYMASYVNDDVDDLDLFMKPIETESEHRARLSQMTRL